MPLTVGTKLGPYEVLAPLGAGGMGEVYRARDTRLDRDVAIKVLPEGFASDPNRRARFEREAKAVAALSHPNILAIFDFGDGGKDYAVVMRNVDGSPPVRLGDGNADDLSPDGRWATAHLFSSGRCVVYPTGAGAVVPVEMGSLEGCTGVFFFPDGKSLLILGNEPGKPPRGYRAAFPGGKPEAVLPEGFNPQRISASGRSVLGRDPNGAWLRRDLGGSSTPVKGFLPGDGLIDWSADERSGVSNGRTMPAQIVRVQFDTGARTKIGEVAPDDRAGLLALGANAYRDNGRQYVYSYTRRVSALYSIK
jgi:hypothetical protein